MPMTSPRPVATQRDGTLLVADISGYTGFLHGVATAHQAQVASDEPPIAYALISTLLDAMVAKVAPRFRLVKFEGDALFAVSDATAPARGPEVIDCLRACHTEFRSILANAHDARSCSCGACLRLERLDLKFVVHQGSWVVQRIAGNEELAGPDVIVAHRLLKNHARDVVGDRPYALVSDAAMSALEVPASGLIGMVEAYEDLPPVPVHVLPLD
jgi:hypothetical protein